MGIILTATNPFYKDHFHQGNIREKFEDVSASINNNTPLSNSVKKEAFPEIFGNAFSYHLKNDPYLASFVAQSCIGKNDEICQQLLRDKPFTQLLNRSPNSSSYAFVFARKCLENRECEDAIRPELEAIEPNIWSILEKSSQPYYFIKACIGKVESVYQKIVGNAFSHFLKNDPYSAFLIATDCIGKNDETCQQLLREKPFTQLLTRSSPIVSRNAFFYAGKCLENRECEEAIRPELEAIEPNIWSILEKSNGPYYFIKACIGKVESVYQKIVKNAFSHYLKNDPHSAFLFAKDCIGKNDEACQQLLRDKQPFTQLLNRSPNDSHNAFLFAETCLGDRECEDAIQPELKNRGPEILGNPRPKVVNPRLARVILRNLRTNVQEYDDQYVSFSFEHNRRWLALAQEYDQQGQISDAVHAYSQAVEGGDNTAMAALEALEKKGHLIANIEQIRASYRATPWVLNFFGIKI